MGDDKQATTADAGELVALIQSLDHGPWEEFKGLFAPDRPVVVARAPGRLDVMGGIADYCGSLVLELPIAEAALAAVQRAEDGAIQAVSLSPDPAARPRTVVFSAQDADRLRGFGYDEAREWLHRDRDNAWVAYVVGTVLVLAREHREPFRSGLRILIRSHVPEGKGVSSSAAIEVATMQAVAGLWGMPLEDVELAKLCQMAENRIVGAPCGIMDQMTAALGRADHLLALLCQPAEIQGFLPVPAGIRFWGIDSGVRHAVSGSDYTSVRVGAFMGYRMIAELAGLEVTGPDAAGLVSLGDPRWRGYLANMTPAEFAQYAERLPEALGGAEFLRGYRGTTDPVTRVDPQRTYVVRQPTAHPVHEHDRVRQFAGLLRAGKGEADWMAMGELMYGSHASYSACGLGSEATDLLVGLVRNEGRAAGLYGARITGGGSGGTVAVLGRAEAAGAIGRIARQYAERTGRETAVFSGSSAGACSWGVMRLDRPTNPG